VHTGTTPSLAAHPIGAMRRSGLSVSCSTDNRLMSGVTLSAELAAVHAHCGLSIDQIVQMNREAAQASFLSADVRLTALLALERWAASPEQT
jgi:adenosine deaminase